MNELSALYFVGVQMERVTRTFCEVLPHNGGAWAYACSIIQSLIEEGGPAG